MEILRKKVEQILSRTESKCQDTFYIKCILPLEPEEWSVFWLYLYVAESRLEVALNHYVVSPKSVNRVNCVFDPAIFNLAIMLLDSSINATHISWWVR